MIRRLLVALAVLAVVPMHAAPAGAQRSLCMLLEGRLPTPDSLVLTAAPGPCMPLRLELAGRPRRMDGVPRWAHAARHDWEVPVTLVNTGATPLELPLRLETDSMIAMQRGTSMVRPLTEGLIEAWTTQDLEQPEGWRFRGAAGATVLRPGERVTRTIRLGTHVVTHAFRIRFQWIDGRINRGIGDFSQLPAGPPLPPDVARFVAAAGFPPESQSRLMLTDDAAGLVVFRVDFLEVERPTAYSRGTQYAVGVRHGDRIGWVGERLGWRGTLPPTLAATAEHVRTHRFVPTVERDAPLFRPGLLARMRAAFPEWPQRVPLSPDVDLLPLLMNAPGAPRDFLRDVARHLYAEDSYRIAESFLEMGFRDPEILTLQMDATGAGRALSDTARARLREMAPELAEAPSTHRATLFALARLLKAPDDAALAARIAAHPNGASSPAILAVLHGVDPTLAPRVLSAVRASEPQRQMLAAALGTGGEAMDARARVARRLADDPTTAEDVLVVLANLSAEEMRDAAWRASRRLPESALRRWEVPFRPRL